jgi:uncharacterized protein with FMN-binding domain
MDLKGKIKKLRVTKYDNYAREMTRLPFLKQFIGKTGKHIPWMDKQIDVVTGATVSCEVTIRAVKEAIILYEELFLKEDSNKEDKKPEE